MKRAEIIAIGSELLTAFRIDTNSLYLTRTLEEKGIAVVAKTIVGDEMQQLIFAFQTAFARSDIVICSGGLGPTIDDLTKEALCEFLKIPLEFDPPTWERIQERFRRRGIKIAENNRKQAMVPAGGKILPNPVGSAPGIYLEVKDKQIFLLPGPPFELEALWEKQALALIRTEAAFQRKIFRIAMIAESQADEMLKPVTESLREVRYTILAGAGEIEVHLMAAQSASDELISAAAEVRAIMGSRIYGEDNTSLEIVVGELLKNAGKTIAVAESCTGGLLAERFTDVAGSSAYFERGVVTYSNQAKTDLLGVPSSLIADYGAVSEPVAMQMAEGIRSQANVDYGLSITGIAGPEGGSTDKPVGTVLIGLAEKNRQTVVKKFSFPGNRERVRLFSSQAALNLLRLRMLNEQ